MYGNLPRPLLSKSGFQGCIASFETNGELEDPIKHALVPSPLVEEGCEGKLMNKTFLLHIRTNADRVAAADLCLASNETLASNLSSQQTLKARKIYYMPLEYILLIVFWSSVVLGARDTLL